MSSNKPVVSATVPNTALVDPATGQITFPWLKWFQGIAQANNAAFDQQGAVQGTIGANATVVGRGAALKTIIENIDDTGIILPPGIDFSRIYENQNIEFIADDAQHPIAGGTTAYAALVASDPITGDLLLFNGALWLPAPAPKSIAKAAHEWLDSFAAATGLFTQSQPGFADISGIAAPDQIGTGVPSGGQYVDGGSGAWTNLPTPSPTLLSVNIRTTSYVAVSSDTIIQMNAAGATTITLPVVGITSGQVFFLKNVGAGTCTVEAASGDIDQYASLALAQWQGIAVYWDGTLWHVLAQSYSV